MKKIPTLVEMKRDRIKIVQERSTEGFISNILGGVCNKLQFVDIPFNVLNDEDRIILDNIIEVFKGKKYNIEKMHELPFQAMTPGGMISGVNVVHRFFLETKITFIEKKEELKTDSKRV